MRITAATIAVVRRPFSSASQEVEFELFNLNQLRPFFNPDPRCPRRKRRSEIRSVGDLKDRWQGNFYLNYFLSYINITSSDVSFLKLDPKFKHGISSYASVLNELAKHEISFHLYKALSSMTQKCGSVEESLFVVDFWMQLSKGKYRLTSKSYNALFKLLARFELIGEMKQLYTDMLVSPGVYPYNLMINGYCKFGYVVEAMQYVCKMIQAGLALDHHTFTSFILGYSRRMDLDSAFQVFKDMPCRSVVSYNHLIKCLCDAGRIDEALSLFVRIKDDGFDPTTYTYNAMIKLICKKNVHKAMRLLGEMKELNLVPDLVTYNLLVAGQCRSGNLDSAYRLIGLIEQRGFYPNHQAYGYVIDFLCKSKRVEEARGLFDSLGMKHEASVIIYNSLIDGYCKAGKLDDARAFFDKMESFCLPDSYTFNALIHGLLSSYGTLKEAFSLVVKMLKMGVQPTVCTRTILIRNMLKEGLFDEARKCFCAMFSSGQKPDAQTYNSFVEAYCSAGRLQEAEGMMVKLKEDGVPPDVFTYSFLIKAYAYLGMTCCAFDVLKRMSDAACEPSHHTFLALIKHLAPGIMWKTMEFDIVVQLFEKMVQHGCTPDANCYEKLILGMCKVENLGIAQRLLDQMEKKGMLPPSDMVFNEILSCCCKLQKYEEAAKVMEDMFCSGQSPGLEHCKTVILRLYEGGEKERGKSVFQKLLCCGGYYDDEIAWKILIEGVHKQGHVDTFSQLFQEMQKNGCHFSPRTHLSLLEGLDPTVTIT